MEQTSRCKFWLSRKKRSCAGFPISGSEYCGNHNPNTQDKRVPCPVDPSHTVLEADADLHVKRCPFLKQINLLKSKPYYKEGINSGNFDDDLPSFTSLSVDPGCNKLMPAVGILGADLESNSVQENGRKLIRESDESSETKRKMVYALSEVEFYALLVKINSAHESYCQSRIKESYILPECCGKWLDAEFDRRLPYQKKHIIQQASLLGNLERVGVIKGFEEVSKKSDSSNGSSATIKVEQSITDSQIKIIEFGAGRGYLTHMLFDCYGIRDMLLVERRSYRFKADRTLRQEAVNLERLRIDIEDLNLEGVDSLKGFAYASVGKHLCGSATDLALRCCVNGQSPNTHVDKQAHSKGFGFATCCHHLCQWRSYVNKRFFMNLGFSKEEFSAVTWFTSWAVDGEHNVDYADVENTDNKSDCSRSDQNSYAVYDCNAVKVLKPAERTSIGLKCKELLDVGRLIWLIEMGLNAELVSYVPSKISPENRLLLASSNLSTLQCPADEKLSKSDSDKIVV